MADWQRTLDVSDVWNKASDGEISIPELAGIIASRLKELQPLTSFVRVEMARLEFVEQFEYMAEEDTADEEDFDVLWDELYDWGNISLDGQYNGKKVCWIRIF